MKLSEYLKTYNLTHKEFGKRVGVSQAHITNILSGKKNASLALTSRIEKETNREVTFNDIFNVTAPSRLKNRDGRDKKIRG